MSICYNPIKMTINDNKNYKIKKRSVRKYILHIDCSKIERNKKNCQLKLGILLYIL